VTGQGFFAGCATGVVAGVTLPQVDQSNCHAGEKAAELSV